MRFYLNNWQSVAGSAIVLDDAELHELVPTALPTATQGYSVVWDTQPLTDPDDVVDTTATTLTSPALADGTSHYLHVKAVNAAALAGPTAHLGPFYIDTMVPAGQVSINGGAQFANSTSVTLSLSSNEAVQMRFLARDAANAGVWSAWEPYATTRVLVLPPGDGTKTVLVEYQDAAGNIGQYSDTIILDTTPPTGSVGIGGTGGGAEYTNSTAVTLNLSAAADTVQMRFSDSPTVWLDTGWEPVAATRAYTLPAGDGPKTVYAQLRDGAGNIAQLSASINLDTTAPVIKDLVISRVATMGRVTFTTDEDTTALVEYGPTTAYGSSLTDGGGNFGRFRRFDLSGLTTGVAYYVRVTVTDRAGNRTVGTDYLLQATGAYQWDYDAVGNRLLSRNPEGVSVSYV